jgi:release factor glutamine methyltransferase
LRSKSDPLRENLSFLKEVETKLRAARVPSARVEAEEFLKHFGKLDRIGLFTGKKPVSPPARRAILAALEARVRGTPMQHLFGEAHFFGHVFAVSPDVLIPRPETETLVQEALAASEGKKAPKILDLCTGSGCIALSLTSARPDCRMTASDISQKALRMARKNSIRNRLRGKVRFVRSDVFRAFEHADAKWDLIVSNPPYIPAAEIRTLSREVRRDPKLALDGGPRGLDLIDKILQEAPAFLEKDGTLLLEIGKGQSKILKKRYPRARFVNDHNGIERVFILKREEWTI